jgi:hypothetical protein
MECDRLNACQYSGGNGTPILETMELVLFKHEFWVKQNPTIISRHLVHLGFPLPGSSSKTKLRTLSLLTTTSAPRYDP